MVSVGFLRKGVTLVCLNLSGKNTYTEGKILNDIGDWSKENIKAFLDDKRRTGIKVT